MNNNNQVFNTLKPQIKLGHYNFDETYEYELGTDLEWVKSLLDELEENTDKEDSTYERSEFSCSLKIKRKSGKPFGDHILIWGHFSSKYQAPCVRCLTPTPQEVDADFQVSFIPKVLETEPEFEELDDIFTENEEFDLYFHDKGNVDVFEMLHENLFMNIDHFPLHDAQCLGLCQECGKDLNHGPCKHQKTS